MPAANFTGTVTINYTVSDASGASSVSTVTVSVGTNNAPSGADVTRSLGEDGSYAAAGRPRLQRRRRRPDAGRRAHRQPARSGHAAAQRRAGGGRHGGDGCAAGLRCAAVPPLRRTATAATTPTSPSAYRTAQARSTPRGTPSASTSRRRTMRRSLRVPPSRWPRSQPTRRWASRPRRISMAMR